MRTLKSVLFVFALMNSFLMANAQIPILVNGEGFSPKLYNIELLASFKGILYFSAHQGDYDIQLYRTDGTEVGTYILKKVNSDDWGWIGTVPLDLTVVNDLMFFSAFDSTNTRELWVTDGTESGTRIVDHFNTSNWQAMHCPIAFDNKLFLGLGTSEYGVELWQSDGTEQGTFIVKDIIVGNKGSEPYDLMVFNNELFFFANDDIHGRELWKTDGTESGTMLLKDINVGNQNSDIFDLRGYVICQDHLFFAADDGIHGAELWKTDGTQFGTTLVKDINVGKKSSRPSNFVNYNNIVYFSAADTVYLDYSSIPPITAYNTELYRTDGSESGTYMVKDINRDKNKGSNVNNLMICNNHLLFTAEEYGMLSKELWVSDGSASGTIILKDIYPGEEGSYPSEFAYNSHCAFFRARDNLHGHELWMTDGSASNTKMVYDIDNGYNSSFPQSLIIVDTVLYFTTDDKMKLWKLSGVKTNSNNTNNYKIDIYPMPFKDNLFIRCLPYCAKRIKIDIYNQLGQCVSFKEYSDIGPTITLSLDYLDAGFYFIKATIEGESSIHKVIKVNKN